MEDKHGRMQCSLRTLLLIVAVLGVACALLPFHFDWSLIVIGILFLAIGDKHLDKTLGLTISVIGGLLLVFVVVMWTLFSFLAVG
jgi:hypothetical protein